MKLIIKSDCGKAVHSTKEWEELCPPLGQSNQWVDYRSWLRVYLILAHFRKLSIRF